MMDPATPLESMTTREVLAHNTRMVMIEAAKLLHSTVSGRIVATTFTEGDPFDGFLTGAERTAFDAACGFLEGIWQENT